MSAAVVVPLAVSGINSLFSLFSGNHASNASKDATAIASRGTDKALDYEKEEAAKARAYQLEQDAYGRENTAYNRAAQRPYLEAGAGAVTALSGLLTPGGRVTGGNYTDPTGSTRSLASITQQRLTPQPITPQSTPGKSRWQAPDGEIREFDDSLAEALLAKGAKKVSA